MTIYNVNFGIGWASSGVEYAQKYRAQIFREMKEEAKYIFLDFIQHENIEHLTSNMDYNDDEIIWIYQYFTDIDIRRTMYPVAEIITKIPTEITKDEIANDIRIIEYDNGRSRLKLKLIDQQYVYQADYYSDNHLLKREFYTYTRLYTEWLMENNGENQPYLREFYNEDGSIAYQIYIKDNQELFKMNDKVLFNKEQWIAYFLESLQLKKEDILIIDRSKNMAQPLIQYRGNAVVGLVIHAEHFDHRYTDDEHILWNHHYEYALTHSHQIDFFVTSTERQSELLANQLEKYHQATPAIYTIPVGHLDQLRNNDNRNSYGLVTASRLANEKHIDWIIKAVIKAQRIIPELSLDIYGSGSKRLELIKLIDQHRAQSFIQLKGHKDLTEVYRQYEAFISASTGEGFGLTLMEAVGSGLAMIGFDVNYGNPTFINDGKNGYLVSYHYMDSPEKRIDQLAQSIVRMYNSKVREMGKSSYEIAEKYLKDNVIKQWKTVLEEVRG